jgi:hypothetical protein
MVKKINGLYGLIRIYKCYWLYQFRFKRVREIGIKGYRGKV